jgi:hypothetical protein
LPEQDYEAHRGLATAPRAHSNARTERDAMNLPDAFPYKGFLIEVEHEDDVPFEGSFDFGDAEENRKYAKQWEDGEVLHVRITVRRFGNGDGAGEVVDSLGSVHLANDGTVRTQIRDTVDSTELRTDGDSTVTS